MSLRIMEQSDGRTHDPAVADIMALPFFSPNIELNWDL